MHQLGVAPANFVGVEVGRHFDVAVPVCAEPLINAEQSHFAKRHHWWLAIIGRLKPGWSQARAEANAKAARAHGKLAVVHAGEGPDAIRDAF